MWDVGKTKMLVFELEMISIAVLNQFCQTISGAIDIHNMLPTEFVNILKERKVMSFLSFFHIYPQKYALVTSSVI